MRSSWEGRLKASLCKIMERRAAAEEERSGGAEGGARREGNKGQKTRRRRRRRNNRNKKSKKKRAAEAQRQRHEESKERSRVRLYGVVGTKQVAALEARLTSLFEGAAGAGVDAAVFSRR